LSGRPDCTRRSAGELGTNPQPDGRHSAFRGRARSGRRSSAQMGPHLSVQAPQGIAPRVHSGSVSRSIAKPTPATEPTTVEEENGAPLTPASIRTLGPSGPWPGKLNISKESVRRWRRKAQIEAGERPGTTSSEHAEIRKLRREVNELRRADEILESASVFSRPSSTAPQRNDRLLDAHRGEVGVELSVVFCGQLSQGSSLHAGIESPEPVRRRPGDPRRAADADLVTVNRENYSVYGVKKMHQAMKRKGWKVGREQTAG
jgi:hypothetical protein